MIGFCVMSEDSFLLFPPLATCCVVNWYSGGKLPLNEHVCAYLWLEFMWWVKIHSFFSLLWPLAVLWTGALLVGKLPFDERVCAYSCLDFVWWVKIHSFFYLLYSLVVLWTGAHLAGKLPLNERVCGFCHFTSKSLFTAAKFYYGSFYIIHLNWSFWGG